MVSLLEEVGREDGSIFPSILYTLLHVGGEEVGMIFKMAIG